MATPAQPLLNQTIAVPETRELEALATNLEALGARVIRCPLVGILDAPDQDTVECWLRKLADGTFNDVILLTGEGLRRLMACARRVGIFTECVKGLEHARKITRGPKPAKALVELGLRPDYPSAIPTTAGVIETLRQFDLSGRHVGIQLYGEEPNTPLIDFILDEGAHPEPVSPYIYAPSIHDENVKTLIVEMAAGRVDMLAFTSATQVKRLVEIADTYSLHAELAQAVIKTRIAAVGPIVAEEMARQGWITALMPKSSFIWKQLLNEIVADAESRAV